MSIRNLAPEQYADRIEWLSGAAVSELETETMLCSLNGFDLPLVNLLDRIKHAAEECAKYLRQQEEQA